MKLVNFLMLFCFLINISCSKKNVQKWKLDSVEIDNGCMVSSPNGAMVPYQIDTSCIGNVYYENQVFNRFLVSDIEQCIMFQIPANTTSFFYTDNEISENLLIYVNIDLDNYFYTDVNGYINGEKVNGEWVITFDITYGGKKKDNYRMKNKQ